MMKAYCQEFQDVLKSVMIDGVSYAVEWAVEVTQGDADSVKVAESKKENHVKLDIPLHSGEDILFTATATVSDAEGNILKTLDGNEHINFNSPTKFTNTVARYTVPESGSALAIHLESADAEAEGDIYFDTSTFQQAVVLLH